MRVMSLVLAAALMAGAAMADGPVGTISVSGEGHVAVAPDMATISVGVTTGGDTAREALDKNNSALSAVAAKLAELGIEARDTQTSGLSLGPRYDPQRLNADGSPVISGYVATNMLTVRVRALDHLGAVLDAVVGQGANMLNGLSFGLQDAAAATDEARQQAMADAKRRAELYAGAAGVKVGSVIAITESGGVQPVPMVMGAMAEMKAGSVPVSAGELSVDATLSVTYQIAQ